MQSRGLAKGLSQKRHLSVSIVAQSLRSTDVDVVEGESVVEDDEAFRFDFLTDLALVRRFGGEGLAERFEGVVMGEGFLGEDFFGDLGAAS